MSERPTLLTADHLPFTVGVATYYDSAKSELIPSEPRIYVRIELPEVGIETLAMVDTGAPWCILERPLAEAVEDRFFDLDQEVVLSTRLGRISGRLYSGTVILIPEEGAELSIQATFFLSPEWTGGNFLGYLGCLDRFRSALDPQENCFYFGPLG